MSREQCSTVSLLLLDARRSEQVGRTRSQGKLSVWESPKCDTGTLLNGVAVASVSQNYEVCTIVPRSLYIKTRLPNSNLTAAPTQESPSSGTLCVMLKVRPAG